VKLAKPQAQDDVSFSSLIEKIEIMRAALRWSETMDRKQIQKLLGQMSAAREDVMKLSHTERFVNARVTAGDAKQRSLAQRRRELLERNFQFDGVFGESPKLIEALEIAERVATTVLPVLIYGESGTGKELIAKVVHANGDRSDKPLITVNCGAIPENLLESELFGHKKGSFTGALSDRAGRFEAANGGTIFLDEIGELPLTGQVKLLRVLQSSEIQRVGSDEQTKVDARVVAATNRDLLKMCEEGTFREDLYYRLSIIELAVPPLRERRDEIPMLIEFLGDEAAEQLGRPALQLTQKLKSYLSQYDYPGNVRELRNIVFRLACLADGKADIKHLPDYLRTSESLTEKDRGQANRDDSLADVSLAEAKKVASDMAERGFLHDALTQTKGNVTQLAKRLEMNRAHVQTLLKKHELKSKDYKSGTVGEPA
jgi:transcriptional regulator with GAF, ATPase, and Fis domain